VVDLELFIDVLHVDEEQHDFVKVVGHIVGLVVDEVAQVEFFEDLVFVAQDVHLPVVEVLKIGGHQRIDLFLVVQELKIVVGQWECAGCDTRVRQVVEIGQDSIEVIIGLQLAAGLRREYVVDKVEPDFARNSVVDNGKELLTLDLSDKRLDEWGDNIQVLDAEKIEVVQKDGGCFYFVKPISVKYLDPVGLTVHVYLICQVERLENTVDNLVLVFD